MTTDTTAAARRRRWAILSVLVVLVVAGAVVLALREGGIAPDPAPRPLPETPTGLRVLIPQILLPAPSDQEAIRAEVYKRYLHTLGGAPLPGTPDLANLNARLAEKNLKLGAPIFMRIFKREFALELWMRRGKTFELFATYPICNWSGALGPKLQEGDKQAPEGFYTVDKRSLNPNSNYHRSFNLGFPNAYDRAHGRTGSFLMVHGACQSIGCYAMTDAVIDEIWTIVNAALTGGQRRFHVHVFPFRMTPENLVRYRELPWGEFWQQLKPAYDAFDTAKVPPSIGICEGRYRVATALPNSTASEDISTTCP